MHGSLSCRTCALMPILGVKPFDLLENAPWWAFNGPLWRVYIHREVRKARKNLEVPK